MLSYRHAFHAGNHADVLKHLILVQVLDYFNRKDAPYWYVDTHAGAGEYPLDSALATKLNEAQAGVARLAGGGPWPEAIARYLEVAHCTGSLAPVYPGSPEFAHRMLRRGDAMRLFELHPTDSQRLQAHFAAAGKQVQVRVSDGFAGLKALLPPPTRRAVVLIDPPYELKSDYDALVRSLEAGLRRFATGCYLVWYPVLARSESQALPKRLRALVPASASWLSARLHVGEARADGGGMTGSGMFVINPPYILHQRLADCLPLLARHLGAGRFELDAHQS
jgi:23S rRNA (adenine2030-N6)-methyltransferase